MPHAASHAQLCVFSSTISEHSLDPKEGQQASCDVPHFGSTACVGQLKISLLIEACSVNLG